MFKSVYVRTSAFPSQALVLESSCGLETEVPIGHEVQWWHMGEDGVCPRLVDIRGPYTMQAEVFDHFTSGAIQTWFASEVLHDTMLEEDLTRPEVRPEVELIPQRFALPEFLTLPLNRPQWAASLPPHGVKLLWPFPATN